MDIDEYQPYGVELYDHQRATLKFILSNKKCFIFDDIGTGKTMSSLSACEFLMYRKKISKVLIIAPISVIRATWCDHILRFFPGRRFTVLHGNGGRAQRLANLSADCDFYIINTDGIKTIEKELIKKKFDIIIIDESTSYSRHSSARTKCAWRICKSAKGIVAMTGNPIPNDTIQSYAQAKLINFDRPRYFVKFRDQLKVKYDMYTYHDKPEAVDLAYAVLTPAIRHRLEDCIDMPPIAYQNREVPMTTEQRKYYKEMEKDYITWLQGGERDGETVTAANAAVRALKLLQISSGVLISKNGPETVNHGPRLAELEEIMGQTEKIIIFANFTASVNALVEAISGAEKIDGSVNSTKRHDIITRFQDGDLNVIVCQPGAISHGVTLTASNTIVWWGPPYSNEHFIQCNGRIRRVGQTKPQLIIQLWSTKMEKKVYAALARKQSVSQAFLGMAEGTVDDINIEMDKDVDYTIE